MDSITIRFYCSPVLCYRSKPGSFK